jgi:hypothetical protein
VIPVEFVIPNADATRAAGEDMAVKVQPGWDGWAKELDGTVNLTVPDCGMYYLARLTPDEAERVAECLMVAVAAIRAKGEANGG